jgi:GNAT superfamily N-acetyltransferase
MNSGYVISTDKSKLDIATIHDFLSDRSYWAQGRTLETVQKTIDNSLCFGTYNREGRLIGFARVVTDFAIFAYLMDVFVLEEYRGAGIGKQLIQYIVEYPDLKNIRVWRLDTKDAHGLYKKYGFTEAKAPDKIMEKELIAN